MSTRLDIVVLRGKAHRMPPEEYVTELRDRIDGYTIELAKSSGRERKYIENAIVATGCHLEPELLDQANQLGLYLAASSGVDHLPLDH